MAQVSTGIEHFIETYQKLDKDNLHLLVDLYSQKIQFQDPLHKVDGLDNLHRYFEKMYANVSHCHFDIHSHFQQQSNAAVYWTMHLRHPKIKSGKTIFVDGHSHLIFEGDKIRYHRDYFDVGSMLYEHLPVVGYAINLIKHRAAS